MTGFGTFAHNRSTFIRTVLVDSGNFTQASSNYKFLVLAEVTLETVEDSARQSISLWSRQRSLITQAWASSRLAVAYFLHQVAKVAAGDLLPSAR